MQSGGLVAKVLTNFRAFLHFPLCSMDWKMAPWSLKSSTFNRQNTDSFPASPYISHSTSGLKMLKYSKNKLTPLIYVNPLISTSDCKFSFLVATHYSQQRRGEFVNLPTEFIIVTFLNERRRYYKEKLDANHYWSIKQMF